jgi:hypothetical protein
VPSAIESGRISGAKIGDAESAQKECARLEGELVELQVAYEQYFLGHERRPPAKQHQDLKRALNQLRNTFVNATNVRFRVGNLQQRMLTFERLWERTLQEIEAGTYKRDVFKARRHAQEREQRKRGTQQADGLDDLHIDEDLDLSDLDADGDDLDSALEQAAAAASASRPPSIAPSIAPQVTPARPVPAVGPLVTPAVPMTGVPMTGVPMTGVPVPSVAPAVAASKPGSMPLITPTGLTGIQAAFKPGGVTGAVPAFKPQGSTGAQPAFKPGQSSQPPRPASAPSKPPAPVGSDGGLNDQKIKAIYDAYVMAKKRCGEDTSKLSLDSVASTLKSQVPSLMKQHNAKSVEFKVVIKDGKAVLRALPKE